MIKKAMRVKEIEYIVVEGSLKCLYALREMLPKTRVEPEPDGVVRGEELNKDGKGVFLSCDRFNVGKHAVPVGDVVWKLTEPNGEYQFFIDSQHTFFKKYKEITKK